MNVDLPDYFKLESFELKEINKTFSYSGVYLLFDGIKIFYIGTTTNLFERIRQHVWKKKNIKKVFFLKETNNKRMILIENVYKFKYTSSLQQEDFFLEINNIVQKNLIMFYPSITEIQKIKTKINNFSIKTQLIIALFLFCGLKTNDLINIKTKHYDHINNILHLNNRKIYIEKICNIINDKQILKILKNYHINICNNEYIFETRLKKKYTSRRIQQIIKESIDKKPKDLRKCFIYILSKNNTNIFKIVEILGIKNLNIFHSKYGYLLENNT